MRRPGTLATLATILTLGAAAQAAARAPAPAPKPKVEAGSEAPATLRAAFWQFKAVGLSPERLKEVVEALEKLGRARGIELLSAEAAAQAWARRSLPADAPAPQRAEALGAAFLINGTAAGLGDEISLDLSVLDPAGAVAQRVVVSLPAAAAERAPLLDELLVRLLTPRQWTGALQVRVFSQAPANLVAGAQIWLDGAPAGTTPLPGPISRLSPGKHIVMIAKEGFRDFSTFVNVSFGKTALLEVDLANATVVGQFKEEARPAPAPAPAPAPPPQKVLRRLEPSWGLGKTIYFFGAVAGALLAGGGGVLWLASEDIERRIEYTRYDTGDPHALEDDLARGRLWHRAGLGLVIGGALLTAGSLLLFFVAGEDEPARTVEVAPGLWPKGAGLVLGGRF